MNKVLITGGAGYIGSMLAQSFLDSGYLVNIVDTLMYNQGPLVSSVLLHPKCTFYHEDIRHISKEALDVDVVYHLAALVSIPGCEGNPDIVKSINTDAISHLTKQLSNNQRLIYCCTNSGYGYSDDICTEETPFRPNSVYGKTKAEGEKIVLEHPKSVSLRLATVYGPSFRPRLDLIVNNFVYQMLYQQKLTLFNGHHRRNFVSLQDVVNVLRAMRDSYKVTYQQTYNVGCDHDNITKLDLAKLIQRQIGGEIELSEHGDDIDNRDYIVSNNKLKLLGIQVQHTIERSIPELVKWFKLMPSFHNHEYTTLINNDYLQDWL